MFTAGNIFVSRSQGGNGLNVTSGSDIKLQRDLCFEGLREKLSNIICASLCCVVYSGGIIHLLKYCTGKFEVLLTNLICTYYAYYTVHTFIK